MHSCLFSRPLSQDFVLTKATRQCKTIPSIVLINQIYDSTPKQNNSVKGTIAFPYKNGLGNNDVCLDGNNGKYIVNDILSLRLPT